VNNNVADGCERFQPLAAHEPANARFLGSSPCFDATQLPVTGVLPSDSRVHENPSVSSFDGTTGSAPEWYAINATGGFCIDDYAVTFTTSGGENATLCYKLTMLTDTLTDSVTVSGSGTSGTSGGSGSYHDGSTIRFKVEKTCASPPIQETISYTITFHL